ncbi:MAG: hypothetical protein FWE51_04155 [Coriobacteriia bacterium]|nr:hypothetical protein [Coriobacteriia bacterium]
MTDARQAAIEHNTRLKALCREESPCVAPTAREAWEVRKRRVTVARKLTAVFAIALVVAAFTFAVLSVQAAHLQRLEANAVQRSQNEAYMANLEAWMAQRGLWTEGGY